jgi:hypothetical protein
VSLQRVSKLRRAQPPHQLARQHPLEMFLVGPKFTKAENVEKVLTSTVLPVTEATHANAGAKAAVCGVLGRLAKDYSTPRGAVLPFGSMELVVNSAGAQKEFSSCLDVLERAPVGSELDDACLSMKKLLAGCLPAEADLKELQAQLKGASIVIARSSANVEDLAGLSGAGLYESIPNLNLADQKSLGSGIAQVWGSLYSRRAVLSRRAAGVAQSDACMGVLVQVCFQDSSINDLNKEENRKLALNYCNGITVSSWITVAVICCLVAKWVQRVSVVRMVCEIPGLRAGDAYTGLQLCAAHPQPPGAGGFRRRE